MYLTDKSYSIGSEYEFVIFSTVRSMPRRIIKNKAAIQPDRAWIMENLGFVTDRHQICVGITRARHGLIIVGKYMYAYIAIWLFTVQIATHTLLLLPICKKQIILVSYMLSHAGNAVLLSYDETWKKLLIHYDKPWDDGKKTYEGKGCIVDDNFPLSKIQPAAINSTMQ